MTIDAWPFLIARTEVSPPRLVVAPDWALTDQRLLAAVRESPRHVPATAAGTAVRRLAQTGQEDFCLVYRVLKVRKLDYGVGGDEPAYDQARRPVEAIEGLVVQCGADEAAQLPVGSADLDTVHAAVIEPYRAYWQHPKSFRIHAATSFPLTGRGEHIMLRALDPWRSLEFERAVAERELTSATPPGLASEPVDAPSQLGTVTSASPKPSRHRRSARVLALAIGAAAVAAGIGIAIARPWDNPPQPVQQPRDFTGTATSDTTIRIRWAAPAAGPRPDHYEINVDGRAITVPGTATSYKLTRLTPGTRYRVWMAALGNGTESRRSATITVRTPAPTKSLPAIRRAAGKPSVLFPAA